MPSQKFSAMTAHEKCHNIKTKWIKLKQHINCLDFKNTWIVTTNKTATFKQHVKMKDRWKYFLKLTEIRQHQAQIQTIYDHVLDVPTKGVLLHTYAKTMWPVDKFQQEILDYTTLLRQICRHGVINHSIPKLTTGRFLNNLINAFAIKHKNNHMIIQELCCSILLVLLEYFGADHTLTKLKNTPTTRAIILSLGYQMVKKMPTPVSDTILSRLVASSLSRRCVRFRMYLLMVHGKPIIYSNLTNAFELAYTLNPNLFGCVDEFKQTIASKVANQDTWNVLLFTKYQHHSKSVCLRPTDFGHMSLVQLSMLTLLQYNIGRQQLNEFLNYAIPFKWTLLAQKIRDINTNMTYALMNMDYH